MNKPTYEVQGHVFTLKPTTIKVRRELTAYLEDISEAMSSRIENLEPESVTDIIEMFDEFHQLFEVFCILTEGPHDELDREDFDAKLGEQVMQDFFPRATAMAMHQIGLLSI